MVSLASRAPVHRSFDSEKAGDREVQRTMLELLNQLDGFQPNTQVKVSAGLTLSAQVLTARALLPPGLPPVTAVMCACVGCPAPQFRLLLPLFLR